MALELASPRRTNPRRGDYRAGAGAGCRFELVGEGGRVDRRCSRVTPVPPEPDSSNWQRHSPEAIAAGR